MENNPPPPPPPPSSPSPPPQPQALPMLWYGEEDQQHRNHVYLLTTPPITITLITPNITFRIIITDTTTTFTITRNNYDTGSQTDRTRRLHLVRSRQGHGIFLPDPYGLYNHLGLPIIIIITTTTLTVHLVLNPDEPIATMFGIHDSPSPFCRPLPGVRNRYEDSLRDTEFPFFITFNLQHRDSFISICIRISSNSITISAYTHNQSTEWVAIVSTIPPSITAL
ncbi:hypothetical protein TanjilG_07060 [Lupinus angustifolius]|uniref:Uncharacterized protein n=1 Tax=Lupinus angustifolius TaxID=3871 RepID=A0A4P1QXP5_LUPAN|nr:hypothetical protein TanjilG_07060 [Lupinus angustifolius]